MVLIASNSISPQILSSFVAIGFVTKDNHGYTDASYITAVDADFIRSVEPTAFLVMQLVGQIHDASCMSLWILQQTLIVSTSKSWS